MKSLRTFFTHKRAAGALMTALAVTAAAAAVLSICVGAVAVSPGTVFRILFGGSAGEVETRIVLYSRLPRTCGCLLAGMALAVSGAVIQSVLSNPLAAPNIIGVNSGAGMMVVLCGALMPKAAALTPIAAFAGALVSVMLVLVIAERTGASKITLVLAGVAVSSIFGAAIDAVVTFVPDALNGYSDFRIGGMANLTMSRIAPAAWVIFAALAAVLLMTNELDVLALGTDTAYSLGLPARRLRLAFLTIAAALAGAAVSFAGLLGFVGLIVPHMIRSLIGEDSAPLVIGSALGGAALLTLCDTLSRTLFAPYELPVGIMLSLIGGPFFIWLLMKQRGGRSHD